MCLIASLTNFKLSEHSCKSNLSKLIWINIIWRSQHKVNRTLPKMLDCWTKNLEIQNVFWIKEKTLPARKGIITIRGTISQTQKKDTKRPLAKNYSNQNTASLNYPPYIEPKNELPRASVAIMTASVPPKSKCFHPNINASKDGFPDF